MMGSPAGHEDHYDDEARHEVTVAPFEMCVTEVTQSQWKAVMGNNPSDCDYGCGDDLPANNMSWHDALDFLNKLSEREQLKPCYSGGGDRVQWQRGCNGFRLPTEAEWEYAARAGTQTAYSFGADPQQLGEYAWFKSRYGSNLHPVAKKQANRWGFYDIHGNVWEWVWDRYGLYPDKASTDRGGPRSGDHRVVRGGSFFSGPRGLRSAVRIGFKPTDRYSDFGLRCARSFTRHAP